MTNDGDKASGEQLSIEHIIAIIAAKGGVGKSTVAANIAVALAKNGASVGLLDADLCSPNIPTMMGVESLPPAKGDKLIPAEAHGVKVISMGLLSKPDQALLWHGAVIHAAIEQLLSDVDWGALNYLVIDTPPGSGDVHLGLAQSIDFSGGVLVTQPERLSLEAARRSLAMMADLEIPPLGILENMSASDSPEGEQLARQGGVPWLGTVPPDPAVQAGNDSGIPVVISGPDCAAAQTLQAIAADVAAQVNIATMAPPHGHEHP